MMTYFGLLYQVIIEMNALSYCIGSAWTAISDFEWMNCEHYLACRLSYFLIYELGFDVAVFELFCHVFANHLDDEGRCCDACVSDIAG